MAKSVVGREQGPQETADLAQCVPPAPPARSVAKKRVKVTYYIWPEQDIALTAIQLSERQHASRRCDKSALVREAIDLLVKQYHLTRCGAGAARVE